jgi:hypothetical protein
VGAVVGVADRGVVCDGLGDVLALLLVVRFDVPGGTGLCGGMSVERSRPCWVRRVCRWSVWLGACYLLRIGEVGAAWSEAAPGTGWSPLEVLMKPLVAADVPPVGT